MTLDEIAVHHGTDKGSAHATAIPHNYCGHYGRFFEPLRKQPIKLLEIGVGGAESIKTWLDFFPKGRIYGVDNNQSTNPWNTVGHHEDQRYTFVYGDQSDPVLWKCFAADYGTDWDIIVDDGGHYNDQIITSFNGLWPIVKPGGLYCVEDLGVSYTLSSVFNKSGFPSHGDWIGSLLKDMHIGSNDIESIHLSKELAIIRKSS